jgi:hypothetical protein
MITDAGNGFSKNKSTMITRYKEDYTVNNFGMMFFIRNINESKLWSTTYAPLYEAPDKYEVLFTLDKAKFIRIDGEIETQTEVIVSPEDNSEIRRITLINHGEKGIVEDWNFGYSKAKTKYVTLAHQDDRYAENYTEEILKKMEQSCNPLIAFTDYYEIRNGRIVKKNTMLSIKRLMLLPLRIRLLQKSKFIRRRILSFGCPICCPSVTYYKNNLPKIIFEAGFRSDEDWQAWEKLSLRKGEFIYCSKALTYHRIHEESATTAIIGERVRQTEDYDMFCKFWPEFIAKRLVRIYTKSEQSNQLETKSSHR